MKKKIQNFEKGISIGRRRITNLLYADDTLLFAANEEEMAKLIIRVKAVSEELGLGINIIKNKVKVNDRAPFSRIECPGLKVYKKINPFVYLGSKRETCGGSSAEVWRRIVLGKSAIQTAESHM